MLNKVIKTVDNYGMFDVSDRVVVGVSGGPDSMALLYCLLALRLKLGLTICVAHLDHNTRRTSHSDLCFVKKISESLGLRFFGKVLDKRSVKKTGSLEEYLRRERYDFLRQTARKFRAGKIAVAHTQDDQAETVLMRIMRGSGLYGLSSILPVRKSGEHYIVRPLIEIRRKDVMAYLKKNDIRFRIDATNFSDKFFRNKVRNRLLPFLEKNFNPNIKEVLSSFALSVGADYGHLLDEADDFLRKNLTSGKGFFSVPLFAFNKLDISLRRIVLRCITVKLKGDLKRLAFCHTKEVSNMVSFRPDLSQVHLPCGLMVTKTKKILKFSKDNLLLR